MKIDRKTVVILIIFFLALVLIVGVPDALHGNRESEEKLTEARSYADQDLCLLAIQAYNEALNLEDTIDTRLELGEVYLKGYRIGEISNYARVKNYLTDLVSDYHQEPRAYAIALEFAWERKDYPRVVELLDTADQSGVQSETIEEFRSWVRSCYKERPLVVNDAAMSIAGTFVLRDGETYHIYSETLANVYADGFEFASPFINGVTLVKSGDRVFLLDEKGVRKAYFDHRISDCTGLGESMLACRIDNSYGYYDQNGNKLFGDYLFAGRFREGVAAVQTEKGWQIINTSGEKISDKVFEEVRLGPSYECCIGGRILAKENGSFSVYDAKLEKVSQSLFQDCDVFLSEDGYAAVEINGKWGFVDRAGELVIPAEYDDAKSFMNGLAAVKKDGVVSYISPSGEAVLTGEFKECGYFNAHGICVAKNDAYCTVIERYYFGK